VCDESQRSCSNSNILLSFPSYSHLPNRIESIFAQEIKYWTTCKEIDQSITNEVRQLTFEYSCQLTALYGAERAGRLARNKGTIYDTDSLVIHVVGARMAEIGDLTRWEIFYHRLPKLKFLTVVFIGPELK
jgi:hypothetical protein